MRILHSLTWRPHQCTSMNECSCTAARVAPYSANPLAQRPHRLLISMSWGYGASGGGEWSNPGWQGKGAWSDQPYWPSGGKGQWDSGKGSWDEGKGWKGKGGGGGKGVVINIGDSLLQAMYRPPGPMECPPGQSGFSVGNRRAPRICLRRQGLRRSRMFPINRG